MWMVFVFCKQKTAYEMRISDWSSDVCSSDLGREQGPPDRVRRPKIRRLHAIQPDSGTDLVPGSRARRVAPRQPRYHRTGTLPAARFLAEQIGSASCRERVCQYV